MTAEVGGECVGWAARWLWLSRYKPSLNLTSVGPVDSCGFSSALVQRLASGGRGSRSHWERRSLVVKEGEETYIELEVFRFDQHFECDIITQVSSEHAPT